MLRKRGKSMKEIIFFDVDDTLLDSRSHKIPSSALDTLQEMQQYYHIGIATGRSLSTLIENGVADSFPWSVYVCNNGQLVYDKNRNIRYRSALDPAIVKQIIDTAAKRNEPLLAGIPEWYQIGTANEYQIAAHKFFQMEIPSAPMPPHADIYMFVAFGKDDSDYDVYRNIAGIQVMSARANYCDIIAENSGKDVGIKEALKLFDLSTYIAFGDSDNDLSMLENSCYSIVMGQGSGQAKAKADFITKAVYEDGIAYAWKHCPIFQNKHSI